MGYHDHDGNDNVMYPICVRVIKRGDRLVVDLTGTSPQAPGSINCARPVHGGRDPRRDPDLPLLRPAVGDRRRCGGSSRSSREPGTLNNALSPAGVSMGSTMAPLSTQDVAAQAFAKMMLCSERYRGEAQANWTPGVNGDAADRRPTRTASRSSARSPTSSAAAGARARSPTGSTAAASSTRWPRGWPTPRRSRAACRCCRSTAASSRTPAGPGRFRGGVAVEFATDPPQAADAPGRDQQHRLRASACRRGAGSPARSPGAAARNVVLRGSEHRRALRRRNRAPARPRRSARRRSSCPRPSRFEALDEGDVLIGVLASGAGYGDALRREPRQRRARRRRGARLRARRRARPTASCSPAARSTRPRPAASASALRAERLAQGRPVDGRRRRRHARGRRRCCTRSLTPSRRSSTTASRSLRCSICHYRYGPYEHDHKRSALMRERPLTEVSRHNHRASRTSSLREFYCPGCATALAADVQLREDPIIDESRLSASAP